ncbi:hypothetical protein GC197_16490 [bacterium]|nr:hypothetical protein [bacterium]
MNLQLNDEILSAFLDGEVTPEEKVQIESMLAQSPQWQTRYRKLVESVNAVRTLPPQPLVRDFSQDILARIAQRQENGDPAATDSQAVSMAEKPQVVLNTATERTTTDRLRKKSQPVPAWAIALAACLLIAVSLGIAYQAGVFSSGNEPAIADNKANLPKEKESVTTPERVANNQPEPKPTKTNPFPTVQELANQQNNRPMEDVKPEVARSPIKVRVNINRTMPEQSNPPGGTSPDNTMVRPNSLARSVFKLDQQNDPGFDQRKLTQIDQKQVADEIFAWVDINSDGQLLDTEVRQAWPRFTMTSGAVGSLSDEALAVIDQNKDQKISLAELNLAVASVRWQASEAIRREWLRLNANGDQVWSQDDFAANARFASMANPNFTQQLTQWVTMLDRSQDGQVTQIEFTLSADYILTMTKPWQQKILNPTAYDRTTALMSQFDRDSNGQLTGRELVRLKEKEAKLAARLEAAGPGGVTAYQLYEAIESDQL